jgi:hypothetical protein
MRKESKKGGMAKLNITMLHDLDTGFLSATLKPHFEALGHDVCVMQTIVTYLEGYSHDHIDIKFTEMQSNDDLRAIQERFKDTDFFIIRSITDTTLRLLNVTKYANHTNAIFKVHGSELRENNTPYSLRFYRTLVKPITVCGPKDHSLMPLYKKGVITHIDKPMNFSIIPKKRIRDIYALHTPTNMQRKGTQTLLDTFTEIGTVQLQIHSGKPRDEILKLKAGASFFIDHIGSYPHGPYGMNSVEAWYLRIPTFSVYRPIDCVFCPELPNLSHNLNIKTLKHDILNYEPDNKRLAKAKEYALTTHDPRTIAQQYVNLALSLREEQ